MVDPNEKMRVVELSEYNPQWPVLFQQEAEKIKSILNENCIEVYHIGSTAIPDIYAKPIIDIMPVVKDLSLVDALNHQFEALGYGCMHEYGIPGRRFYWKSNTKRTHHIHLFEQDSTEMLRHLAFRNFMLEHRNYALAYSLLKRALADVFHEDIENYVKGKSSFIQLIDYKTGMASSSQLLAKDNIVIEPYNPVWPALATAEINAIKALIGDLPCVAIEHIGSTAVPGLASKPIIDILIAVKSLKDTQQWIKMLEWLGYIFWDDYPNNDHLRFFKGMPPYGMKRTHHVHIVEENNDTFDQRILFRDGLRRDKKKRFEYETLKLKLSQSFSDDREGYTDLKGHFIEKVLQDLGYLKPIKK